MRSSNMTIFGKKRLVYEDVFFRISCKFGPLSRSGARKQERKAACRRTQGIKAIFAEKHNRNMEAVCLFGVRCDSISDSLIK